MLIELICIKGYSHGQNDTPLKLNNINVEAFGSGIGYSINYDKIIPIDSLINISLSVGYEYNDEHFLLSQFNILIGHTHYFEVGYGYLYCLNNSKLDYSRVSSLRIGYRFENINRRGLVFRIGLTPLLNYNLDFNPIGVMGGISLGFNF
jgi:hypothetical protein